MKAQPRLRGPVVLANAAVTVLAALALLALVFVAGPVLIPIAVAIVASYVLAPAQRRLVGWRVPRRVAAALIVFALVCLVALAGYGLRSPAVSVLDRVPAAAARLRAAVLPARSHGPGIVSRIERSTNALAATTKGGLTPRPSVPGVQRIEIVNPPFRMREWLWRGTAGTLVAAGDTVVVVILLFHLLASGHLYRRKLIKIANTVSNRRLTIEILDDVDRRIARYLIARAAISGFVGTATWLAFWLLGMPEPVVWGVAAGGLNVIPYIGPLSVAIAALVVAALHFGTILMAIVVPATAVVIATIEAFGLTPWLMGEAGGMNVLAVFLSLSIWGWLWGFWGLLLAVPLMMFAKAVVDYVQQLRAVRELIGE